MIDQPAGLDALLVPFVKTLKRFCERHVDAKANDVERAIPVKVLRGLAKLGAFGVSIPEAWGGSGLGLPGSCAVVETLARHDRSVATTIGLHLGLGTRPLVAFGSDALKDMALPKLASGDAIAAFATTEPNAGSDLRALATTAVPHNGGLRVNGRKIFVTNGGFARFITIAASTPGLGGRARGQSLVLLRGDDPGLTRGSEEKKLGLRASSTTELNFEDLDLPTTRVVGEAGHGAEHLGHVLAWGRTVMAAGSNGTAQAALEATIGYVTVRRQFGQALATMPIVRAQVAEMAARQYASRALVRVTAAAQHDEAALKRWSLAAKVLCSENSGVICDAALQLHGGMGYIEESGIPLLGRDARITRIFEGANDVLAMRLGTLESARTTLRPAFEAEAGSAGRAANALAQQVAGFRDTMVSEYGMQLIRRPRRLHQLGRATALSLACDAAVTVALTERDANAIQWAEHFVGIARGQLAQHLAPIAGIEALTALTDALYEGAQS